MRGRLNGAPAVCAVHDGVELAGKLAISTTCPIRALTHSSTGLSNQAYQKFLSTVI